MAMHEDHMTKAKSRPKPKTKAGKRAKVKKVMHEFDEGNLHSGSGGMVGDRDQAVAIAMRMAGMGKPKSKAGAKRKKAKRGRTSAQSA